MALRPATPEEIGQVKLPGADRILQEQGVTVGERAMAKNFTANPAAMKRLLQSWGYEVRKYNTGGFNFAIRRGPRDNWRVVDPDRMELQDLLDIATDVLSGVATGLGGFFGSAGGPLGTAAGAVAAGTASELARQGIGSVLGVPENIDPLEAGIIGGIGGAVELAAPALGAVTRSAVNKFVRPLAGRVGEGALELGARLVGIRGQSKFPAREVSTVRAKSMADAFMSPKEAGENFERIIKQMDDASFPAVQESDALLKNSGRSADITDIIEEAKKFIPRPRRVVDKVLGREATGPITQGPFLLPDPSDVRASTAVATRKSIQTDVVETIESIQGLLFPGTSYSAVPLEKAQQILRVLQAKSFDSNISRDFKSLLKRTQFVLRRKIDAKMVGLPETKKYLRLRSQVKEQTEHLIKLKKAMRGPNAGERFINSLYSRTKGDYIEAIHALETQFNVVLEKPLKQAVAGELLGEGGRLSFIPQFTAVGSILGPSLFGLGAGIALTGENPQKTLPLLALSALPFTSRGFIGIVRGGLRGGRFLERAAAPGSFARTGFVARPSVTTAIQARSRQQSPSKGLVREDKEVEQNRVLRLLGP